MAAPVVRFTDATLHVLDDNGSRALLTFRPGVRAPVTPDGKLDFAFASVTWSLRVITHVRSARRVARYSGNARFSTRIVVEVLERRGRK